MDDFLEDLRKKFNHNDIARQAAAQLPDDQALKDARDTSIAAWDHVSGAPFAATRQALEAEMRRLLEPVRPEAR